MGVFSGTLFVAGPLNTGALFGSFCGGVITDPLMFRPDSSLRCIIIIFYFIVRFIRHTFIPTAYTIVTVPSLLYVHMPMGVGVPILFVWMGSYKVVPVLVKSMRVTYVPYNRFTIRYNRVTIRFPFDIYLPRSLGLPGYYVRMWVMPMSAKRKCK